MTAEFVQPRRRAFTIRTHEGPGEIAAIELGDPARAIDVLFVHANGFNALTYRAMLSPLAGRLRVLAIDLEGHGRSPQRRPSEGREGWDAFAEDLIALLGQLEGSAPVLAGHSMGGAVAGLAAAARPDKARALVLFDPAVTAEALVRQAAAKPGGRVTFPDMPLALGARRRRTRFASLAAVKAAYQGRGAFETWPDQALEDYIADGFRPTADGEVELVCAPALEAANFTHPSPQAWSALQGLRMPVSILRARRGSTCAIKSADGFVQANPAFEVATIEGSTHFLPIESPELARAEILRFAG